MAGVNMENDGAKEVKTESVPSIGGDAEVVQSDHLDNEFRANGVDYNENPGVDVTTSAYPEGNDFGEANNPLKP